MGVATGKSIMSGATGKSRERICVAKLGCDCISGWRLHAHAILLIRLFVSIHLRRKESSALQTRAAWPTSCGLVSLPSRATSSGPSSPDKRCADET